MGKIAMKYRNDPRSMTAKFKSTCSKCQRPIPKDSKMYYWPASKTAMHEACGETDYNQFLLSKADEEMYNNY